jgi:hypothetical protein
MLNRKSIPCVRALRTERAREIDRQGSVDRAIFGNVKDVARTVEGFHAIRREQWMRSACGDF